MSDEDQSDSSGQKPSASTQPKIMSSVQQPPPFNFDNVAEWPAWLDEFEDYMFASGLSERTQEAQVRSLLYCMGRKAREILKTFNLTDAEFKNYELVKGKYNAHFVHSKNVVYESACFNRRVQEAEETVDQFVTELHTLAARCEFGELKERLIRDRFIVGLRDAKLSETLQMDAELTLDTALAKARLRETVRKQQKDLAKTEPSRRSEDAALNADSVSKPPRKRDVRAPKIEAGPPTQACENCGYGPHQKRDCPARNKACMKCKKVGHFARKCRRALSNLSKTHVAEVHASESGSFLGSVCRSGPNARLAVVTVNGHPLRAKIDSGADVTVVGEDFAGKPPRLLQAEDLKGPNKKSLDVLGKFKAAVEWQGKVSEETIYVVRDLQMPLLGMPAIESLGMVRFLNDVSHNRSRYESMCPEVFQGLGTIQGEHRIQLKPDAEPFAVSTPRRIPFPMRPGVEKELQRLEATGIIRKVHGPTDWCAPIVPVQKPSGDIRICVDLTKLNVSVRRERHIMPTVEEVLANIDEAKFFSKLDANSGFHQIVLSPESQELTTFITPFGRYCYKRLPFGITSAPEVFQRKMTEILDGLQGIQNLMDDVLVYGATREEHDNRLRAALQQLARSGVTLNPGKCQFGVTEVSFLGVILDKDGIRADPKKVKAIQLLPAPTDVSGLRRVLGMVNHVARFLPTLSQVTAPLRELLRKNNEWTWGLEQQRALDKVKQMITSERCLAKYDSSARTIVSADSSSHGLGAVLLQEQRDGELRAVAFASRSLTPTEQRYAQIEKEALALTWAAERFEEYLRGLEFVFQTDHKPLVPLLGQHNLDMLPPRVQRFRMHLMRYSYKIEYIPGKNMATADTLSRAPCEDASSEGMLNPAEVSSFVLGAISTLPASEDLLQRIRKLQREDQDCASLFKYCEDGWPSKSKLSWNLKPFFGEQGDITVC